MPFLAMVHDVSGYNYYNSENNPFPLNGGITVAKRKLKVM